MLYFILIFLAVISRLLPHAPNVAPIGALALFAGTLGLAQSTKTGKVSAYLVPLLALLVSDFIIGFYTWQVMVAVYVCFGLTIGLGLWIRKHYSMSSIVTMTLVGAIVFFLLTNAAVWAFTPMYAKSWQGLMDCYIAALPFFRNSLIGDFAYASVLFGTYELAKRINPATIFGFARS